MLKFAYSRYQRRHNERNVATKETPKRIVFKEFVTFWTWNLKYLEFSKRIKQIEEPNIWLCLANLSCSSKRNRTWSQFRWLMYLSIGIIIFDPIFFSLDFEMHSRPNLIIKTMNWDLVELATGSLKFHWYDIWCNVSLSLPGGTVLCSRLCEPSCIDKKNIKRRLHRKAEKIGLGT